MIKNLEKRLEKRTVTSGCGQGTVFGDMMEDLDKIKSARLAMLELCEERELLCYDILYDLQIAAQQGESLYYYDDMHFNPNGNLILAELVQRWLDEEKLLP